MRVALYCPLKHPDHPVPSGDRRMARQILAALRKAGHQAEVACRFGSRDGRGDPARQVRIARTGTALGHALARRYARRPAAAAARPEAWITYHLYHKAPDHLGPVVAAALDIPYLVIEASDAPKRATGPWETGFRAARHALAAADLVMPMTRLDAVCLARLLPPERLRLLPPFLDDIGVFQAARTGRDQARARLAAMAGLDPARPWLLAVGMMRAGDKLDSYRVIGRMLADPALATAPLHLLVAGDGPARTDVMAALEPAGGGRVHFLGALAPAPLAAAMAASDILVWPAVREAYGMALLEAQAAGLPVVAGRTGGVPDVVEDGVTGLLAPPEDAAALAALTRRLIDDQGTRARLATAAAGRASARDLAAAAAALDDALLRAARNHAARRPRSTEETR
ncbi:glycosyltransferase family 4 protein [Tistrella mobilis]|uniref:glycosyltransferase family 4 protein n=1 Tax=Tistrella mobilis TaxID=171437 RepID=UPI003558C202